MSEETRTADDASAAGRTGDLESATPTARQASSMALMGVVVVLVLVAIAGVWWYVTSAGAAAEAEAATRMKELGAFVRAGQDTRVRTVNLSLETAHQNIDAIIEELPALTYLENLNARNAPITDEHLATIGQLDTLLTLDLTDTEGNSKVTDAGMAHLADLDSLLTLELYGTSVSDEGLKSVGQIQTLKILNIGATKVKGDLSDLLPLENLGWLVAGNMELSDEIVGTLANLPKLTKLSIPGATISDEALRELREKKPGLEIN